MIADQQIGADDFMTGVAGDSLAAVLSASDARTQDLAALISEDREGILAALYNHGALLFRGFAVSDPAAFERVTRALTDKSFSYIGGGSPRSRIAGEVFTSTEYSSEVTIPLHNEASYFAQLPAFVWFCCAIPSEADGETPLGDMRAVLDRLSPELVERFQSKGLCYVTNLSDGSGFGKSWKDAYQSDDRDEVEERLKEKGLEYSWREGDRLRVIMRAPSLRTHPVTGKAYWGNQVVNWHDAVLPEKTAANLRRLFKDPWDYPKTVFFGDGTPIPAADVHAVASVLDEAETTFLWQTGDVILVDNQAIAHGRRPFSGKRQIMVALA
jgi:alpha-ketoglutarate-dependent taurine dioxygenase